MKQGRRFFIGLVTLLSLMVASVIIAPIGVWAAGETFTWKDNRTITVSGGGLDGTSQLTMQENPPLTGSQTAIFHGNLLVKRNGQPACEVFVTLYLFRENGDSGGRLWNPPPWDGPVIGPSGGPPRCFDEAQNAPYHNQWITIGGTRPNADGAPEREEEKLVRVTLFSSEPLTRSPPNATITIKKAGANVAQQTVPREDDSGAANYPPEQTPVIYGADFKLEPGDYQVCATYVLTECQNFKKEKYKPLFLQYGKRFEMPHERKIIVHVVIPYERPCGSTFTSSPITVTATGPSGNTLTQDTPPGQVSPAANEQGAICTVNGTLTLTTEFIDGVEPGTWRLCVLSANKCVDGIKKPGEPLEVTIRTIPEVTAPENDPVCSTGVGLAGVTAWILCPLTEFIIRSTEFIERNLIVPFMTVSPLQTGSPAHQLWESMRNIANILFIIAFFIIIFSQATSFGISNYGIKRLLPKLGFVVVGTNLSFYIVAFIIDAFNVFGGGISELVMTTINNAGGNPTGTSNAGNFFVLTTIAGTGLAIGAAITSAGAVLAWLFSFIGIAFLILLVAVVVLVLRQIIILLLVLVSPFAFVAWLLPNTEKYFSKWWQLLLQLLLMYPIIVLLFAAGKIVQALISAGQYDLSSGGDVSQGTADTIKVFMGFFAAAAPLIFLPLVFSASGNVMSRVFGAIQNRGREWGKAGMKKASEQLQPWMKEKQLQMARSSNPALRALGGGRLQRREYKRQRRQSEYERAKAEYLSNQVLANRRFAKQAAGIGGEEGMGRANVYAESVLSKLIADELRMALEQLRRGVMSFDGAKKIDAAGNRSAKTDTDDALIHLAKGGSLETDDGKVIDGESMLYREAAVQRLADDGRSDQIRELQAHFDTYTDPEQKRITQAMTTRAIKDNAKSLLGKAPDLVKGPGSAFGDATANTMVDFNAGTMTAMAQYMSNQYAKSIDPSLSAAEQTKALGAYDSTRAAFEESLRGISKGPILQAKFSGEAGRQIIDIGNGAIGTIHPIVANEVKDIIEHRGFTIDPITGKVK